MYLAIFLSAQVFIDLAVCNDERKRAIFEEISSPAGAKDVTIVSMFHKSFHQCGINDGCEFVAKNVQTNEFKKFSKEGDLPEDRENHRIWIKKTIADDNVKQNEVTGQQTNDAPITIAGSESCKEAQATGVLSLGVADLSWGNGSTFKAPCDMTTDGGGWTVFQRRRAPNVDFNRGWNDYVRGFGDVITGFWVGLEALHHLTKQGRVKLRIDLTHTDGKIGHGEYSNFKVGNATSNYEMTYNPASYSGSIGDALLTGKPFTTRDKDNDDNPNANCAAARHGGFWYYDQCDGPKLNGLHPAASGSNTEKMTWYPWKSDTGTIVLSEMKLRRED